MGLEQGHILPGGAAGGEAGGGLDVVRAGLGHQLAQLDLLRLGEQAGFHDHLEDAALAGGFDSLDLGQHLIPPLILHPADVDHHVDLVGAVADGVLGLKDLDGGGRVAVGETDDGADLQLVAHVVRRLLHKGGGNAHGGAAVLQPVVADLLDLGPGRLLFEQSVVAVGQDVLHVH